MKNLTESQTARLEEAVSRVDALLEERPVVIPDEIHLAALIRTFDAVVELLSAGQTILISVDDEAGHPVALARLAIEPAAR